MVLVSPPSARSQAPSLEAVLTLLKPVTWFAPMWAFMCGVVSSGQSILETWPLALAGAVLAGPLLCATSQAANDWFDRHVDAINEPGRPIPSGRIPGRWGFWIALIWSGLSLVMAAFLGVWVFGAALVGLALAWGYSAPPFRWKQSGWWGPAAVAVSYEGLAWFTGAAVVLQALPDWRIILLAILYSIGAHGIMTLNDFKSVEGDRVMGVRSLPVQLGAPTAARLALAIMVAPQLVVVGLWLFWGQPFAALGVALAAMLQMVFAQRLLRDPRRFAPWFNATGVLVYVAGMLISAIAVGSIVGAMA
jgi:chlorophyll synthase